MDHPVPRELTILAEEARETLAEVREREELVAKISLIDRQLALYDYPEWEAFAARLKADEEEATEALLRAEDPGARARVKYIRHLAGLEQELRAERARLTEQIMLAKEEDDG